MSLTSLTHLSNFVRIAELQNLSKAAAVIRIAQPALSRQVRNLEAEVGGPLLVRHARGVSLTPAGEILLVHARRMAREAEAARDALQALSAEPTGRVALGVPVSLARALVPPLAETLARRYPRLRPHFVDGFSASLHGRMLSGDLDLSLLYEDRAMGPLTTAPLLAENLVLVGPPDGGAAAPTTAAMLRGRHLILPARPNRLRLIVDEALTAIDEATPVIMEVDSLPAIIGLVERGAGYAVLPYSAVAEEASRAAISVSELRFPQLSRTLLLAQPVQRQPTAAIAAMEQELRALVSTLALSRRWNPLAAP